MKKLLCLLVLIVSANATLTHIFIDFKNNTIILHSQQILPVKFEDMPSIYINPFQSTVMTVFTNVHWDSLYYDWKVLRFSYGNNTTNFFKENLKGR